MFYETLYETGRMSVANYEDDAEAQSAIEAHHGRAVRGEPGGPVGQPAERIVAVYKHNKHPNEFNPAQTMSEDVLSKELAVLVKRSKDDNGVVSIARFAMEVGALSHPFLDSRDRKGFGTSFYKAKDDGKLDLAFLADVK